MNARCFSTEILQEIEVRPPAVIDGNHFSIDDRSLGQIRKRVHDVGNCVLKDFLLRENSVRPVRDLTARARYPSNLISSVARHPAALTPLDIPLAQ
jgi:hypothetical protein